MDSDFTRRLSTKEARDIIELLNGLATSLQFCDNYFDTQKDIEKCHFIEDVKDMCTQSKAYTSAHYSNRSWSKPMTILDRYKEFLSSQERVEYLQSKRKALVSALYRHV